MHGPYLPERGERSNRAIPNSRGKCRSRHQLMTADQAVSACQDPVDFGLTEQESLLVELLAPHPGGHLGVALAGIARAAAGDHVVEHISPAARDGQHAIFLQRGPGGSAVRAATPGHFQRGPLGIGEVVHFQSDAPPATPRVFHRAGWASRHRLRLPRGLTPPRLPDFGVSSRPAKSAFRAIGPLMGQNRAGDDAAATPRGAWSARSGGPAPRPRDATASAPWPTA